MDETEKPVLAIGDRVKIASTSGIFAGLCGTVIEFIEKPLAYDRKLRMVEVWLDGDVMARWFAPGQVQFVERPRLAWVQISNNAVEAVARLEQEYQLCGL